MRSFPSRETGEDWEKGDALRRTTGEGKIIKKLDRDMKIQLLSNEPCREDAFEGHSHQHIAEQIVRIIKDDADRHIIGIEGGWGSGKSNLISLVNKGLNGDTVYDKDFNHKASTFPFFVYDAWGHQVDYQRRAILEELTHDLTLEKKILGKEKWETRLQELLAKRRKTTTKEVPRLGVGFIVSIILTILTPLVVFLVGLVPDDLWCLKMIVALLPYFTGIGYAIQNRKNSLKEHEQESTWQNILSELILVYKDQIKENETYTTVSEKEPSSAEFKKWMDEVDTDLKALNKNLVIVFDNMDRLPAQKVESLWSSIHSFFSDKTYDNIKVLIPFDRQHVQMAFKNEDTEGESYGNDFINKTFDVVFRVPPPIMTGWQQYMADMWKKAFGEDAQLHISVTQIYDALSKNHTPRKIIAFINEVATVKMTMHDDIPDKYIALFIFGKETIEKEPIKELLYPSFMGDVKFEYEKDSETVKYLSALYYQLPVDNALDVVFTREATEALNTGDTERLHDMMEHIELSCILGNAILKVNIVDKAVSALAGLDNYIDYADYGSMPSWLKQLWEDLYQKCLNSYVAWNEINEYHVPLYQHLLDESLANELVEGYLSIEDDKLNAKLYVETIKKLKENNDYIDRALEKYQRKVTPKLLMEILKYTKKDYKKYGVTCDFVEVDSYLSSLEQSEVTQLDVIPYMDFDIESDFPDYKSKLQEWLGDADNIETSEVSALFLRLKEVSEKPLSFADFYTDAGIYKEWNNIDDEDNPFKYDLLAMRIARRSNFNSSYESAFTDILEDYTDEDAEALAKAIEYYVSYGDLLLHSDYYKKYPLVATVVEMLTDRSYGISRMSVMDCLVHFDQTIDDYQLDAESLFERLNGWIKYVSFTKTKVDKLPTGLLEAASTSDSKLAEAIHDACDAYYSSLSQDQWKEHITKKDDTYRIWIQYHPKKYQANFDALKSVLKDYANGGNDVKQPDKGLVNEWLRICMELNYSVKGLFTDVSSILKRDSMITKQKLLFFGGYILEYTDLEKQKDFVQKLIPSEIMDTDVIGFVAAHIDTLKDCDISDEFKEKVKHLGETTMKDDKGIRTIYDAMGIEIDGEEESEEA